MTGPSPFNAANLDAALALAAAGIFVFPAKVSLKGDHWAKVPCLKNWQAEATTDPQKIRAWWKQYPHAAPGIELGRSGLLVIDADRHGGPDGVAALEQLAARHGGLPKCPLTLTAGSGRHYVFRQPEGEPLKNRRGALPPGIDVRGVGGWAVAPGATRADGRQWRSAPTTPSLAAAFSAGTIPAIPTWVVGIIQSRAARPEPRWKTLPAAQRASGASSSSVRHHALWARQALREIAAEIRQMPPNSGRNERLNSGAFRMGKMVASGFIDKADVADELSAAGIASGLDIDEVQRTLASGLTAGMQQPAADPQDRPRVHVNGHANGQGSGPASTPIDWPDPVPLPTSLLPVAHFDYGMLPENVRTWVEDATERMQSPADYAGVTVMTALGSLIGRKITVRPKLEDDWSVVPNFWGLLIGPPGVMKTPSQNEGLKPLRHLEAAGRHAYALAKAEYEVKAAVAKAQSKQAEKEAAKALAEDRNAKIDDLLKARNPDGEPPVQRRYIARNTSVEALAVLMQQNPNGLLVDRDEMLSLLDRLDEEGHSDERGFYLSGANGDTPYTFDRIGRGLDLHCEAVTISMIGGTQPARISQYLAQVVRGGRGNDGLIQRFSMMVWPDISEDWRNVDRKPKPAASEAAFKVFEALDALDWRTIGGMRDRLRGDEHGLPYLRLSPEAHKLLLDYRTKLEHRLRQGELEPMLEGHLAKYRKLIPGLALIIHLADGGKGPVDVPAIEKALKWAAYLETHAARTYASTSIAAADAARAITAKIKSGHLKAQFGSREIIRAQWSKLRHAETVHAGLQLLADYDWLTSVSVETRGRKATVYKVNPKALSQKNEPQGGN